MSINHTINGLASLSFEARVIADRLHKSMSSSDTASLQSKVSELESTISLLKLQHASSEDESTLSDDDVSDFFKRFALAIKPCSTVILESVYTQHYFNELSPSIRAAAARAVAVEFESRGIEAPMFLKII